ncbi:MAG: hypothetical protein LBU81_05490 [Methanosarcinales archaeon]|nr:hypothetical protein [Methanosarcinales archaeon]
MALLDTLSTLPLYVYVILFIVLVIIVAVVFLLIGKRKYNQDHGIIKEKKVRAPKEPKKLKQKTGRKVKYADDAVPAGFTGDFSSEEEDDGEADFLKPSPAAKPSQKTVSGQAAAVGEKNAAPEKIIEWKPPAEDKKAVVESSQSAPDSMIYAAPPAATASPASAPSAAASPVAVSSAAAPSAVPPSEPPESGWNDEDLELFEARAYSFDEETQSGYISDKPPEINAEKQTEVSENAVYPFRERKGPSRDPSEDEGVQVFETKDEKPESASVKPVAKEEKVNNSKYAYFDSVMEREKSREEAKWQPPQERTVSESSDSKTPDSKKKSGMQYIELDLNDKE